VRSLIHSPEAVIHSPAAMVAACPTNVTRSRCPRALARRTQKPCVVVSDALDEPGQHLLSRWFRLCLHVDAYIMDLAVARALSRGGVVDAKGANGQLMLLGVMRCLGKCRQSPFNHRVGGC
jgi:hypothetical protein